MSLVILEIGLLLVACYRSFVGGFQRGQRIGAIKILMLTEQIDKSVSDKAIERIREGKV